MAGDWIKFELATLDKPEVVQMADLLGTSPYDVVGRLLQVWGWFDRQSLNGHAGNVTGVTLMSHIDRMVGSQGFAACMKNVGWLDENGLPNFDRHNGETSKNRALAKDRKAKQRSREERDICVTREEKRREEKKISTNANPNSKVIWSESGFQIPSSVETGFKAAYPAIDLAAEVAKAHAWALANPAKRKSDWGRFLNNWLANAKPAPQVQNHFAGAL